MSKQKKCALSGCNKNARRKFCSNKHKDKYHNLVNPRGIYSHLKTRDVEDDFHPFDPYALGQD